MYYLPVIFYFGLLNLVIINLIRRYQNPSEQELSKLNSYNNLYVIFAFILHLVFNTRFFLF
jgi:hypothetical protein